MLKQPKQPRLTHKPDNALAVFACQIRVCVNVSTLQQDVWSVREDVYTFEKQRLDAMIALSAE